MDSSGAAHRHTTVFELLEQRLPEPLARRVAFDAALLEKRGAWRGVHTELLHDAPFLTLSDVVFPMDVEFSYAERLPPLEDVADPVGDGESSGTLVLLPAPSPSSPAPMVASWVVALFVRSLLDFVAASTTDDGSGAVVILQPGPWSSSGSSARL